MATEADLYLLPLARDAEIYALRPRLVYPELNPLGIQEEDELFRQPGRVKLTQQIRCSYHVRSLWISVSGVEVTRQREGLPSIRKVLGRIPKENWT